MFSLIAKEIKEFFLTEIRNESFGGDSPATLDSAAGTLAQAPIDVIAEWAKTENPEAIVKKVEELRVQMGGSTLLKDLI
jgi:hypothetical protein